MHFRLNFQLDGGWVGSGPVGGVEKLRFKLTSAEIGAGVEVEAKLGTDYNASFYLKASLTAHL